MGAMKPFTFRVYNKRHDSVLTYRLEKTDSGWDIQHIAINGPCSPDGSALFYTNFEQDNIQYPVGFGAFLEWLWGQLDSQEISESDAQTKLQELADWVSLCERGQPRWHGWN